MNKYTLIAVLGLTLLNIVDHRSKNSELHQILQRDHLWTIFVRSTDELHISRDNNKFTLCIYSERDTGQFSNDFAKNT